MKDIFTTIVEKRLWLDVPCGTGSTMTYTQPLRSNLKQFLELHKIQSILDAPCGDHSWMSQTPLPDNIRYIGGDIVESMIAENKATYNYPNVEFICLDISNDPLPDVDLLFCRDCLIHFSHSDIIRTFKNIIRSNIKYVLITNYDDGYANNQDIQTGGFRPISFTQDPYNFDQPVDKIVDWAPGTNNGNVTRHMNLWHRSAFEKFLSAQ